MLYHYTSARLLEKIIADGKLRPSGTRGWRLLWATSAPTVDRTALCAYEPIVARFILHSDDFEPWTDVRSRFQKERREMAERMERRVHNGSGMRPEDWYVRHASLPAKRWLRIDTRDQRWQPYASSIWRQRGSPQVENIGDGPETMDAEGLADYRYETMDDEAAAECRYRFEKED